MSYIVTDYCLVCGKARGWTRYSLNDKGVPPEQCTCTSVNSAASSGYYYARLIPENMQALEAMIRRVVAEELAKVFQPEEKQEQLESEQS